MCMWFFQNPEIIFYHFFRIFNLDIFWVLILQKSIGSRYLVPLTPPTVFGRSFWNFTWAFRMAWRYACGFFQNPEIIFDHFFRIFNLDIFLSSNTTEVYREQVPCPLNSSHSFWPILLNLYRCFKNGLKMCMWFFQNPEIYFYYFLDILNIDIFWVLILQKRIGSRYLVSLTPPIVFGRSFWNFTWAFRMAWKYACGFFRILK